MSRFLCCFKDLADEVFSFSFEVLMLSGSFLSSLPPTFPPLTLEPSFLPLVLRLDVLDSAFDVFEETESPRNDDQNEFPSLSLSFDVFKSEDVFLLDFEAAAADKEEDFLVDSFP